MINNYDNLARHYDFLSRLVFSKSQVNAQVNQLAFIANNSSILIVGGGTGWILEEIVKIHPKGLKITYVEISSKMIDLSKARNCGNNEVLLINSSIEEFDDEQYFDCILTPFLFDNFSAERCGKVFQKLNFMLNNKGLWLLVDFTAHSSRGVWWKKLFLYVMYKFFSVLSHVEAKALVNMIPFFENAEYKIVEERFYYSQFIQAIVFQKQK